MRAQSIPAHKYTIYTQLGKEPKDYPNGASMPSVQVALKLMARGKRVKAKDVMSFVICGDNEGKQESAAKNAYPMDEVLGADFALKPDIDYYLHKQILPPVERLCAPMPGTNVTLLAECLGLDTTKYRVQSSSSNNFSSESQIHPLESQVPDEIRFKDCTALHLLCLTCRHRFQYSGLASSITEDPLPGATITHAGIACPRPSCAAILSPLALAAQLDAAVRAHTARYQAAWLVCDEATCSARTRGMSVYGHRCLGPRGLAHGCQGKMTFEYQAKQLYTQLLFLQGLFDPERTLTRLDRPVRGVKLEAEEREKMKVLVEINRERWEVAKGVVSRYLERSGWGWVDMESLFGFALKAL